MDTPNNVVETPIQDIPHVSQFNVGGNMPVGKRKLSKSNLYIIVGVLFVVALILAFFIIDNLKNKPELSVSNGLLNIDPNEAKVASPLTGEFFPVSLAEKWINVRPLSVMINNAVPARPQSGLIHADIVYEMIAEGGITRFLAFYNSNVPEIIGPVRSTREYYLRIVKELGDAMLMHEGFSPQAQIAIDNWPVRSLYRGGAGCPWEGENDYCLRYNPRNVAIEHTAYAKGPGLIQKAIELGWDGTSDAFVAWQFKDDPKVYENFPVAENIAIDFWDKGDYSGIFKYDTSNNSYLRSTGYDANDEPVAHLDQETSEQIKVSNVIVQFVAEIPIAGDDKSRLEYELVGSGTGIVFIDGKAIDVTWNKTGRDERTMFYDLNGEEVKFNRGKFWVSVVPDRNTDQVVFN